MCFLKVCPPTTTTTTTHAESDAVRDSAGQSTAASPAPDSALSSSLSTPAATPPSPDALSYATLIATLEQAGQDRTASQVLNRLPPLEKEVITATYVALIHVWASQVAQRNRKRY